jgi:hypothetical protein
MRGEFLENMIGKRLKSKISVASSTDMDHDARKESEASIRPSASSTIAWGVTKTTGALWAMLGCARLGRAHKGGLDGWELRSGNKDAKVARRLGGQSYRS